MKSKKKLHIKIALGVIITLIVIGFVASGFMYYSVMNRHVYTYKNARGITSFSDYTEMQREESNFESNNADKLKGYFYTGINNSNYEGVIIVNNGFGAGHEAMLAEIQVLVDNGFLVYGFDKTGYDDSEGKGIGSLSQGVNDLLAAVNHVKDSEQAKDLEIILYGKSWGAYCCLATLKYTDDISAVISMSAFNKTSDMMASEATRMIGTIGNVFVPFITVYDLINEKGMSALEGLEKTNAQVLIMHSIDDETVSVESSYMYFKEKCAGKNNIYFKLFDDKNHSIIKSNESVLYNRQMDEDLQVFADMYDDKMTEQLWEEFLSKYDLKKCTQPDTEVMRMIIEFIQ